MHLLFWGGYVVLRFEEFLRKLVVARISIFQLELVSLGSAGGGGQTDEWWVRQWEK